MNFREKIPAYTLKALTAIESHGYQAYVVGGAVRDLLIGRIPTDFDLSTSAMPDETIEALESAGIKYIDNARKHGTIMAIIDGNKVEITTFRIDGEYKDSRRPESVEFTRSIEEDVKRRDFTINSLYLDKNGEVIDITGGIDDLNNKVLRAVGEPETRFREDALRIMRGLRFSAELGFEIEENTRRAMSDTRELLKNISGERIQVELSKLLVATYASNVIRDSVDVISVFIPELELCEHFDQMSKYHNLDVLEHTLKVLDNIPQEDGKRNLVLALAAFFHDISKPECFYIDNGVGHMKGHPEKSRIVAGRVLSELKYPNEIKLEVEELVKYHDTFVNAEQYKVHKFMSEHSEKFFYHLEILQRADILAHSEIGLVRMERLNAIIDVAKALKDAGKVFSIKEMNISGNDIIGLGVKPGPVVGQILDQLFSDYLQELVPNNKEELLVRAQMYVTKC